ncbi:MAG: DEAD/DEAH box helicase, partial [SAR324 cluster bacterium]|nr:DEAD/DEAH box helicase [SAR324 cluster bacterium]
MVIIQKHCVSADQQTGLSPLQEALLRQPEPVRIADAPTGAGKSYAFQYAMRHQQSRVLFIVPTKRLAQNLAGSLIHDLMHNAGFSQKNAENKVALWSGDETQKLKEQGVVNVRGLRLRQMASLDETREGGEMIFAVPETISHLLLRFREDQGLSSKSVLDFLTDFHHIVFDEFHTIEPRGFGLAGLFAVLAAHLQGIRAKISFLSATPLNLQPVLRELGVPPEKMVLLCESVGPEGRPIHGDVQLHWTEHPRLVEVLTEQAPLIQQTIQAGNQVMVIYDRLDELKRQQSELSRFVDDIGLDHHRVLIINSIDDSSQSGQSYHGFARGRQHDPDQFDLIVATASVEMGVTLRACYFLIMEPGFAPMNFLQRYGRAARRGHDGQVWVRFSNADAQNKPWLRNLKDWMGLHEGQLVSIQELTQNLSRDWTLALPPSGGEVDIQYFGELPRRAAFTTGLYWNVLMRHPSMKGHRFHYLKEHQPKTAKLLYHWIQEVRKMEGDREYGYAAKRWCDQF